MCVVNGVGKIEQEDENDVCDHRQPVAAQKPFNEELSSCGAITDPSLAALTGCCFQATPPAAPPPSQPPQQQPAEPEGEEDGEERFQARVVGCKRAHGVLTWLTDYGVEWEDRFHHEPMESFEGGGLKLLHDFHTEVRVEQAMDKKVCPPSPPALIIACVADTEQLHRYVRDCEQVFPHESRVCGQFQRLEG